MGSDQLVQGLRPPVRNDVGIHSDKGFEVGIELVAKARRLRRPVAELPTIWLDRTYGASNFKIAKWLPAYLRWYRFSFGPRLALDELHRLMDRTGDNEK